MLGIYGTGKDWNAPMKQIKLAISKWDLSQTVFSQVKVYLLVSQ